MFFNSKYFFVRFPSLSSYAPASGNSGVLGAGAPLDVAPATTNSAHQFPAPAFTACSIDASAMDVEGGGADSLKLLFPQAPSNDGAKAGIHVATFSYSEEEGEKLIIMDKQFQYIKEDLREFLSDNAKNYGNVEWKLGFFYYI